VALANALARSAQAFEAAPRRVKLGHRVVTRDIRPSTAYTICDVCGRTLLRGEQAHIYIDGGSRRSVCELCTSRAVQEGWIREGTLPPRDGRDGGSDRRRSLIGRLRRRRERRPEPEPEFGDMDGLEGEEDAWEPPPEPAPPAPPPPVPAPSRRRIRDRSRTEPPVREPRRVHAVPTSNEHKIASAIELFNGSEHTRTVAGVARSLGPPEVSVRAVADHPSLVNVVVAWELCWYRYEIDLSDDVSAVRVSDQGVELDELEPEEREPNAGSDETGSLALRT
jgi:hypothetical protein